MSLQGGLDAIIAAEQLASTLNEHPGLLDPATWPALRDTVLTAATKIQELRRSATAKDRPIGAVVPLAGDWIAGWTLQEIHSHYELLLDVKDITVTSDYIDKVIVQDLAWAVSSLLQILEIRYGITPEGLLAALPAMLKYGVDTVPACYAASLGIHQRSEAIDLAARCPIPEPSFSDFTGWLGNLTTDEITAITSSSTASLLIRSAERRSPRTVQKTILSGRGTFTTPCAASGTPTATSTSPTCLREPSSTSFAITTTRLTQTPSGSSTTASLSAGSPRAPPGRSRWPSTTGPPPWSRPSCTLAPGPSLTPKAPTGWLATTRSISPSPSAPGHRVRSPHTRHLGRRTPSQTES